VRELRTNLERNHSVPFCEIYIEVSTKPAAVDAEVYIASSNNGTYKPESYVTPIENRCRERFNQISLLLIPLLILWSTGQSADEER